MSKKIKIGVTDLSFHHVAASLVSHVLKDMGFEVECIYSHHEKNFDKLRLGEVDLLASAWLPSSHGVYKKDVEKVISVTELGLHYKPYALWGVPDYVPKSEVSEISDLLKISVSKKMNHYIQGINPGAGISRFSKKIIEDYNLSSLGYEFHNGTEEECFGAFERAVEKREWLIIPLWKPQFLHHRYAIRELKDPKGLLGIVDRAVLLIRDDRKSFFSQEQINVLDSLRFNNDIIADLDFQVCREGRKIDAVTNIWLKENKFIS